MPVITFNTIQGALDKKKKTALSKALTDAVANILGEKIKPNTWVIINESPEGNFHIGGHALTADAIQKLIK